MSCSALLHVEITYKKSLIYHTWPRVHGRGHREAECVILDSAALVRLHWSFFFFKLQFMIKGFHCLSIYWREKEKGQDFICRVGHGSLRRGSKWVKTTHYRPFNLYWEPVWGGWGVQVVLLKDTVVISKLRTWALATWLPSFHKLLILMIQWIESRSLTNNSVGAIRS